MICGLACLGLTGLGEIREPVFAPVLVVAEMESGTAGICWLIEIDAFDLDVQDETY